MNNRDIVKSIDIPNTPRNCSNEPQSEYKPVTPNGTFNIEAPINENPTSAMAINENYRHSPGLASPYPRDKEKDTIKGACSSQRNVGSALPHIVQSKYAVPMTANME